MIAAFIIAACVLALVLGIVGVWNAGCAYGDKRRLQEFRAHAMVADELHRRRIERKGRAA
ncbi:hypothetical protein [Pseudoxanthomonas mexicana]|uniref:hypothetical protein n=1 Tax=Pseudoxanthomonas mexicana TaxID=128785 RepID=UPI0024E1A5ED|nr:hypothetical protein [Pseudoxanthomonas mexicana]